MSGGEGDVGNEGHTTCQVVSSVRIKIRVVPILVWLCNLTLDSMSCLESHGMFFEIVLSVLFA